MKTGTVLLGCKSGIGATGSKLKSLTSNQYYKGLNNRFEKRVSKLIKAGYRYDKEFPGFYPSTISKMVAKSRGRLLHNQFVMHADSRAFNDELKRGK